MLLFTIFGAPCSRITPVCSLLLYLFYGLLLAPLCQIGLAHCSGIITPNGGSLLCVVVRFRALKPNVGFLGFHGKIGILGFRLKLWKCLGPVVIKHGYYNNIMIETPFRALRLSSFSSSQWLHVAKCSAGRSATLYINTCYSEIELEVRNCFHKYML